MEALSPFIDPSGFIKDVHIPAGIDAVILSDNGVASKSVAQLPHGRPLPDFVHCISKDIAHGRAGAPITDKCSAESIEIEVGERRVVERSYAMA
jgi:hypothetical protein